MRRIAHALVIAILVSSPADAGQRRVVRPSTDASTPLDSIGIMQPESVRAILLLYMGRSLSKSKATEFEADLLKKPENIDERITLIGYYEYNGQTALDRL